MTPRAAVGVAVRKKTGELLLIHRKKQPEADAWGLPGGKVDFGEPVKTAAIREVQEELGIDVSLTHLACIAETIDQGDGAHWVAPVYGAEISSGMPELVEPEKHHAWGWFSLDALPAPLTLATQTYLQSLEP